MCQLGHTKLNKARIIFTEAKGPTYLSEHEIRESRVKYDRITIKCRFTRKLLIKLARVLMLFIVSEFIKTCFVLLLYILSL